MKGKPGRQLNLIIYTGGAREWQNDYISSDANQIWQVKGGKMVKLVGSDGNRSMVKPNTLTRFIRYCRQNFPANRYDLIMWDHGSGSSGGCGYDEKHEEEGSMSLAGINKALDESGVKFDMIGFDACLMGTVENAAALSDNADYLLASEESEPGDGWHYTKWIRALTKDPSLSTLRLGKLITDDFIKRSVDYEPAVSASLSLVDRAEFSRTLPEPFAQFAAKTNGMITGKKYNHRGRQCGWPEDFGRLRGRKH